MTPRPRNTAHILAALDAIRGRSTSVGLSGQPEVQTINDLSRAALNAIANGITRVVALEKNDTLKPEFQQASIQAVFDEVSAKVQGTAQEIDGHARALVQAVSVQAAPKMPFNDPTAAEVALLNARTLASSVMDRAASGQKAAALLDLYVRARSGGDVGLTYLLGATDWAELMLRGSGEAENEDLQQWQAGVAQRFADVAPAEAQKARAQLQAAREWLTVPTLLLAALRELTSPDDVNFFEALMIKDTIKDSAGVLPPVA